MNPKTSYDRRLIPQVIDAFAQDEPQKLYASIPVDDHNLQRGWKDVTFKQFANAINAATWWLESHLGPTNGSFETFGYFGPRDLRYTVLIVAAMKVRRTILLTSLFASLDAHVNLASKLDCHIYLFAKEQRALIDSIEGRLPTIQTLEVPELATWLDAADAPAYPFTKSYQEAENDPAYVIHTSGTTGLPKPVIYTHGHAALGYSWASLPDYNGKEVFFKTNRNRRYYLTLPIFHGVGVMMALWFPCFMDSVVILGPANTPPSVEIVDAVLDHASPQGIFVPPFLLEAIHRDPSVFEKLYKLEFVCFLGAPLSRRVGEKLRDRVLLWNAIGTTECGGYPTMQVDPENWEYHCFHPNVGATFEPQDDGSGLYELVIKDNPNSRSAQNLFRTFPDKRSFRTSDLWTPHPTKFDHWKFSCRTDDLVLLTGEIKLYSGAIEGAISQHPVVKGVLVGGDQRICPFMLVELFEHTANDRKAMEDFYRLVDQENQRHAPEAHITKDFIIFAPPERPFVRSMKSSIERRRTFAEYKQDIDALYEEGRHPNSVTKGERASL